MPNIYVRSADGDNADNGSTWALAKATLAGAAAIDAAGDTIFVADGHSESTAGAVTITLEGSVSAPVRVICVDDTGDPEPPTSANTGAVVATTGSNNLTITVSTGVFYLEGIRFKAGDSTANARLLIGATNRSRLKVKNCALECGGTNATSRVGFVDAAASSDVHLENTTVKFAATGSKVSAAGGTVLWDGGGIESGSAAIVDFIFSAVNIPCYFVCSGLDLSAGATSMDLVVGGNPGFTGFFRNCKLPSGWTGRPVDNTTEGGNYRVVLTNCDDGDTNYRLWIADFTGSIREETTIVRSGGASDGDTPLSWKMASSANANTSVPLASGEIAKWNATTGSAITATVEVVTDNVTLTDQDCYLEVQYLGTSGVPLSVFTSDSVANTLGTPANQTTSSETWTTTGLTTPVKQKLSVSFTPQEKGFILAKVKVAKTSTTVYVDPVVTIT